MQILYYTTKNGKPAQIFNGVRYFLGGKGYYANKKQEIVRMNRAVWTYFNGPIPDGYIIHHKDHDKSNNEPNNLELMEELEHTIMHHIELATNEVERICVVCNQTFKTTNNNTALYCSVTCNKKAFRQRRGHKTSEAMSIKAKERHAKSKKIIFTCVICNQESEAVVLPGGIPAKKYCSAKCKNKAKRLKFLQKMG
jgi:hypothetical protein